MAARIARAIVDERLAACASILPGLRSIYRWAGKIADESEVLLIIKTRRERFAALASRVKSLHPYQVVEIVALPVETGHEAYLKWLDAETVPVPADPPKNGAKETQKG